MVQIRNVPSEFHRRLKARAAIEGMSMSDYILREVGKALDRPTRQEVLSRLRGPAPRQLRRKCGRRHPRRAGRPVIVLDASAVVELLLDTATGRHVATLIDDPAIGAPRASPARRRGDGSVLRRFARDGVLDDDDASAALEDLVALDLHRHSHESLLERAWALRKNVTAYDAMYVALAQALEATLVTCDGRLARAPGIGARVQAVK